MNDEELYEFRLSVPSADKGEPVNVTVQIEVKDGNIVSIKGSGEGNNYEGTLSLKMASGSDLDSEARLLCIVCDPHCHIVVPCP
jgi:hypothetical protein